MTFPKGVSGNPGGRPSRGSMKFREMLENDMPGLIKVVRQRALAGDMAAMKLLLDRGWAVLKPVSEPVLMPELVGLALTDQARAVLASAAAGEMTTDAADTVISAIAKLMTVEQGDALSKKMQEHIDALRSMARTAPPFEDLA